MIINKMKLFNQAVLEMKLSKNNFCEMVTQLIRDRNVFERLIKEPILYIGFINSKNIGKNDLKASKDALNKLENCIIFGVKNKMFSGKNVEKFYNWKGMQKINKLEENVKLLENEVKEIRYEANEIRNEVMQIKDSQESQEKAIDELKNLFLNFARQYEINNNNIFDKLNQINSEQNRNNPNDISKSCNILKKKRKRSHN